MFKRRFAALATVTLCSTGVVTGIQSAAHAATTYYVATNGSATNSGTESAPFASVNDFMAVAQPGDTVMVRGGTYTGENYLSKSGTAGNPITIRNYPGEIPIYDGGGLQSNGVAFYYGEANQGAGKGSYIVIDGFVIRNYWRSGINIGCCYNGTQHQTVSNVVIRNNVIDRTGQNGITFMFARDVTVEHNLVGRTGWDPAAGSWSSGINLYGMYGTNNLVRGNVSYHNVDVSANHTDGNGYICDLSYRNGGCTFTNNIAFENGGGGIVVTHSAYSKTINNTTYENGRAPTYVNGGTGILYYGSESADTAVIVNNVAYQSTGLGYRDSTGASTRKMTVTNNDFAGVKTWRDPKFVDAANANFALQSTSPAINAGTSSGAPADSLVFDRAALVKTTVNQPVAWYRYAPDYAYIASRGEVRNLFGSVARPQGGGFDQGAYEYTTAVR